MIPVNLEEAIKALDEELLDEDKEFIKENKAIALHHSLGTWIRNNWMLWADSELKQNISKITGLEHPDDISNYIIKEYKKHLENKK